MKCSIEVKVIHRDKDGFEAAVDDGEFAAEVLCTTINSPWIRQAFVDAIREKVLVFTHFNSLDPNL